MKLSELLYYGEYTSLACADDIEIRSLSTDTSKIEEGCLFICVCGSNYNPLKMLSYIKKQKAAAVIVEKGSQYEHLDGLPVFEVDNARKSLSYIYSRYYGSPSDKMKIIGVTGTNGKTSTSYMLRKILMYAGYKVGLIGTVECLIGDDVFSLPDTDTRADRLKTMTTPVPEVLYEILKKMCDEGVTHVIMEVSSHALALDRVAPINFECGIFTNLAPEHLDFHKDMNDYMLAKSKLFCQCKYGIFNCDNEYSDSLISLCSCEVLRCSAHRETDYCASKVRLLGSHGVDYTYNSPNCSAKIKCDIPAVFTVYNSLSAISCALSLGISLSDAQKAIAEMKSVSGRLERIALEYDEGYSVFIDYAHTEEALRNLLTTVRHFRSGNERIVLIFGCGGDRDKSKRAPMGKTAEELADFVIVTTDNPRNEKPREIIRDILVGMKDINRRRVILDRKKAIEYAILNARENDIIILAGKGHESYQIDDSGSFPFDERKIVQQAQLNRKKGDNKNENSSSPSFYSR